MPLDPATVFLTIVLPLFELLGFITAVHAIMNGRTSQGSAAWAISLVTFPYLSLPLYWVFGKNRFNGYVEALRHGVTQHRRQVESIIAALRKPDKQIALPEDLAVFEKLAGFPFTSTNGVDILINGSQTFERMLADIDQAEKYILLQYYIIHDDELGKEVKRRLVAKARRGVGVYLLYDEIGCHKLPGAYIRELERAGARVSAFKTTKGRGNRFQLNFRNHRKITLVDGRIAYVGGHNIGDEYMGRHPRIGTWRDTHVRVTGPSVRNIQFSFVNDWYWATRSAPHLQWSRTEPSADGLNVLVLSSGPADRVETCSLMFINAIQSARHRVWIANPYFIPSEAIIKAIKIAALRGVEIRIMLPMKSDNQVVHLAGYSYINELNLPNIRFFRYQPGFLHQKVFLVDDRLASVGTANMDNRSFRLNFEITVIVSDARFAAQVERMLASDFSRCREVSADAYTRRTPLFRFAVKLSRLLSPIL